MTPDQLEAVENEVNAKILENLDVVVKEMPVDEAKKAGAMALFGEKYGDVVRVVTAGEYSKELCGGTHLKHTGEAGLVKILGESGISAGVRRIEALTGFNAMSYYKNRDALLKTAADTAKASADDIVKKIEALYDEIKNTRKELEDVNAKLIKGSMDSLTNDALTIKGIKIVAAKMEGLDMNALRNASDTVKNKIGSGVVILVSSKDDKVNLIVSATKDAVSQGIHCGNIIKDAAAACGGGGGGRPDMAQAGGKDPNGMDEAIRVAKAKAFEMLG
jgi:alanyl-tRNA synthetase